MKRTSLIIIMALSLCFISGSGVNAQRTLKQEIPVTSTIQGNGDPIIFNYRIQGDARGPYRNDVDSVISIIQTGGDYELNALSSLTRTFFIDFRDPVPNSNPSPPFSFAQLPARVVTKSYILYGHGQVAGMRGL